MQKSDVLTWEKKVYKPQINIQVRHLICIMPADLALSKNLFFFILSKNLFYFIYFLIFYPPLEFTLSWVII